jgi:hypothetical protein
LQNNLKRTSRDYLKDLNFIIKEQKWLKNKVNPIKVNLKTWSKFKKESEESLNKYKRP